MQFDDPKRLYFFFDYISHNAYLAWCRIRALTEKHGLTLEPVPVLFAGLLSHYKQVGPAEVPAKSRWMLWNVLRKATLHGIAVAPPASHPFNPLLPLRVSCAVEGETRLRVVERLFRATWAESRAVSEAGTVHSLLEELALDADALLAAAQAEPAKQGLRQNTEGAIAVGVFGVPSMRVRAPASGQSEEAPGYSELFWGFDDLEFLDMYLQGRDVLASDRTAYRAWFAVKPSAVRKPS